ncbi:MAG: hypothetical protein ACRDYV_09105 [Acidimicrobiia bacterium]
MSWSTVMDAVVEHGSPLVEDPGRVGPVRQLGLDETSFLRDVYLAENVKDATTLLDKAILGCAADDVQGGQGPPQGLDLGGELRSSPTTRPALPTDRLRR